MIATTKTKDNSTASTMTAMSHAGILLDVPFSAVSTVVSVVVGVCIGVAVVVGAVVGVYVDVVVVVGAGTQTRSDVGVEGDSSNSKDALQGRDTSRHMWLKSKLPVPESVDMYVPSKQPQLPSATLVRLF